MVAVSLPGLTWSKIAAYLNQMVLLFLPELLSGLEGIKQLIEGVSHWFCPRKKDRTNLWKVAISLLYKPGLSSDPRVSRTMSPT